MRVVFALAAVALAGTACGGKAKSKIPDEPQPRPPALVAAVAMPSAQALLPFREAVSAVNDMAALAVDPSIVMTQATSGVGAASLDVIDQTAPVYALWLDDGSVRGLTIVGKLKDDDDLRAKVKPAESVDKNGWVAIAADKTVLDVTAGYALTTLVQTPPTRPNATIYTPAFLAHNADKLVGVRNDVLRMLRRRDPGSVAIAAVYVDGAIAAIKQSEEIHIAIEPTPKDAATLDLEVMPTAGSQVAAFVADQKPSDLALLSKLPDKPGPYLLAGHVSLDSFAKTMSASKGSMPLTMVAGAVSGDLAVAGGPSHDLGFAFTALVGLKDPGPVDMMLGAAGSMISGFASSTETKDGVTYHLLTRVPPDPNGTGTPGKPAPGKPGPAKPGAKPVDPKPAGTAKPASDAPPVVDVTALAIVEQLLVATRTPSSLADATHDADVVRGKTAGFVPPPELAAEITAAKSRKDSFMGAIVGSAISTYEPSLQNANAVAVGSLGFATKTIHLRATVPVALLRLLRL